MDVIKSIKFFEFKILKYENFVKELVFKIKIITIIIINAWIIFYNNNHRLIYENIQESVEDECEWICISLYLAIFLSNVINKMNSIFLINKIHPQFKCCLDY